MEETVTTPCFEALTNQLIVLYGERLTNYLQRKEKQEWICSKADHSRFLSIPSAFVLLPEFPYSIPEVGCGQRPRKKQSIQCLICHAKKSKRMYKILSDGYTVNRNLQEQKIYFFTDNYLDNQRLHNLSTKSLIHTLISPILSCASPKLFSLTPK